MTTLTERPTTGLQHYPDSRVPISPDAVIAISGHQSMLEVAQAYFLMGERPIPLCDAKHMVVQPWHRDGYSRKDGTVVAPCKSPGKAPFGAGIPTLCD